MDDNLHALARARHTLQQLTQSRAAVVHASYTSKVRQCREEAMGGREGGREGGDLSVRHVAHARVVNAGCWHAVQRSHTALPLPLALLQQLLHNSPVPIVSCFCCDLQLKGVPGLLACPPCPQRPSPERGGGVHCVARTWGRRRGLSQVLTHGAKTADKCAQCTALSSALLPGHHLRRVPERSGGRLETRCLLRLLLILTENVA